MRNDTYISNLDALQDWFELNQAGKEPKPFFTLWRGFESQQNRLIFRNEEVGEADASWELLKDIIASHSQGGGTFRVYLTSKPGHNIGVHTIVKIANSMPANVAGINGAGGAGMFGIYGSAQEMVEAEVQRRMEVFELRQEVEALKSSNTENSAIGQFKELMGYPAFNNLVQMFGMKMMGMAPVQQAQPRPTQPMPNAVTDAGIQGDALQEYDYDIVEPALDKLSRVFPNVEMTLDKLAEWATQNPEMARSLFGNIQQPGT